MRLLILTQAVDLNDTSLSFFHRWIEMLAERLESVTVICLKEGTHALPANVRVYSLGKEGGQSRIKYVCRLFRYIWELRGEYDSVFVHMNQEYVLLAGWLWRVLGKRICMWRNYHSGNILTDLAAAFCHQVFCTSTYSYTARHAKTILMPVGVDLAALSFGTPPPASILSFGRIAPSKRIEVFIEALKLLADRDIDFSADIRGNALPEDESYRTGLKARVASLGLTSKITFGPGAPIREVPGILRSHALFVNASPSGMYDKMIFEAAASGCLVVASSGDWAQIADNRLTFDGTSAGLAEALSVLLGLPEPAQALLRKEGRKLAEEQSLTVLVDMLVETL